MALTYTKDTKDSIPEVPDNGQSSEDVPDISPVATTSNTQVPTAGVTSKSKDTYVKLKLSIDKATPDTWFKLIETKSDGIKIFENDKKKLVVLTHPERSAIMLYDKKDMNSFFETDARKRNNGLLGRFYVGSTVPTVDKPESRLYVSGKFHAAGLVDALGNIKGDSIKLYGGIVGLEGNTLMQTLKERADFDRDRSEAYKAKMSTATPSTQPSSTPDTKSLRPGDDLQFGM